MTLKSKKNTRQDEGHVDSLLRVKLGIIDWVHPHIDTLILRHAQLNQ